MNAADVNCLGFFNDTVACGNCPAVKRCRAVLVADGFDIIQALLDEIIEQEAATGIPFYEKDKVSDNIDQLLRPEARKQLAEDDALLSELFDDT